MPKCGPSETSDDFQWKEGDVVKATYCLSVEYDENSKLLGNAIDDAMIQNRASRLTVCEALLGTQSFRSHMARVQHAKKVITKPYLARIIRPSDEQAGFFLVTLDVPACAPSYSFVFT